MQVKVNPMAFGIGAKQQIQDGELALLSEGDEIMIKSKSDSEFLILAGPELNEPIERYGPFVMNLGRKSIKHSQTIEMVPF